MKVREIYTALILLLVPVLILGIYQKVTTSAAEEYRLLQKEISPFIIPPISYRGRLYTISHGLVSSPDTFVSTSTARAILRTARYSIAQRFDPIFALDRVNTGSLRNNIRTFSESVSEIASFYEDKKDREAVLKHFYPLSFLQTLPGLQESREMALYKPSFERTDKYHTQLINSIDTYRDSALETSVFLRRLSEKIENPTYHTPGGSSTLPHFAKILEELAEEAALLMDHEAERFKCFRRYTRECTPLSELFTRFVESSPSEEIPPLLYRDVPDSIKEIRDLKEIYQSSFPGYRGTPEDIFAIVIPASRCIPSFSPAYYFIWESDISDGISVIKEDLLNDIYFRDLASASKDVPYFKKALESGALYLHQGINQIYICPDVGVSNSEVLTLYHLNQLLKDQPLAAVIISDIPSDLAYSLETIETRIVDGPLIVQEDAKAYFSFLARLLSAGEMALAEKIGNEEVLRIESLLNMWQQQSSTFDSNTAGLYSANLSIGALWKSGSFFPIDQLFMTRSAFMTTYLGFNKSFVKSPISFVENRPDIPLERFALVSYLDTIKEIFPRETIEKMLQQSVAIHQLFRE